MAIALNPAPLTLGIVAPFLGPWFSRNITLGAPDASLRVPLTLAEATHWLPPATGTLSLFVADPAEPPAPIAHLQDASGNWPFASGVLVAYFRLLPEVEARLDELMRLVPAATAAPITSPPTSLAPASSRPRVRALAMTLPVPLDAASVLGLFTGPEAPPGDNDTERIEALGLALDDGEVTNGALPMTWLRRPGRFQGVSDDPQDRMLVGLTGSADLWAFDHRGRAIDPGAVASWWSWLLSTGVGDDPGTGSTVDYQLLAPGIEAATLPQNNSLPAVAGVQPGLTAHLVDAHEGPLGAPFLNGRLQAGTATATTRLLTASASSGLELSFSPLPPPGTTLPPDNPQVDDAPLPRLAVLPSGSYAARATVWPGGPVHAGLGRDFVRVAVIDEERHLLGVGRRDSREQAASHAQRRASAQNRPSTRTSVSRTAGNGPVLLATADAASAALLQVFASAAQTRAVLGVADLAWGASAAGLAVVSPPGAYPPSLTDSATLGSATYRVRSLAGGGTAAEDRQAVLVEVELGAGFTGAWVRAWPLGFDLRTGLHFRLTGGGGRVASSGVAHLVMTLANGRVDAAGLLSMDMVVAHRDIAGKIVQRSYADRRFTRPAPDTGAAANAGSFTGATSWAICETGQTGTGPLPAGSVPAGGIVVVTSGTTPAVVDRTTIPAAAWSASTLRSAIQAGDMVSLTQPAFQSAPDRADTLGRPLPRSSTTGDPTGGLGSVAGVIVHRLGRDITSDTASSAPYTLQDRLEVAAASVQPGATPSASAVIGGAPPLPWVHEQLPHFLGHPGAPAAIEIHGTGVALDGPPALAVAEYVRERTAGLGFGFVHTAAEPARSILVQSELAVAAEAATPLPAVPAGTGPGPVVAVLRTGPVGQEGLPGAAVGAVASDLYPFSQRQDQLETWLDGLVIPGMGPAGQQLRAAAGTNLDSMTRALDRRIQVPAFGAREVAVALVAAIGRAQDLVYIETPALDNLVHNRDLDDGELEGDAWNLWQLLIDRMTQRRGLHVVVCVPTLLLPGTPRKLQEVRDAALLDALEAMRASAGDRLAVFSPGAGAGRAVRFATTTVVVDDVLAITGSTHLWRRGLTWDSSLAAAVFDERVVDGRSQEVLSFRLQLLAARLGLPSSRVPLDAAELVRAIRDFDERGSVRLSATAIVRPEIEPTATDQDIWNPDGSVAGLTFSELAELFAAALALTDVEHAIIEG